MNRVACDKYNFVFYSTGPDLFECLDYQIPVTQLKGDGEVQVAKRNCNSLPARKLNILLCGRQTD